MNGGHHMQQGAAGFGNGAIIYDSFDPVNHGPDVSIINSNKTALGINGVAANFFAGARGVIQIFGKVYIEFPIDNKATGNLVGLCSQENDITDFFQQEAGDDGYAWHMLAGQIIHDGALVGAVLGTYGTGDNLGFAIDVPNSLMWMRLNGDWKDGDPELAIGGQDISAMIGKTMLVNVNPQRALDEVTYNPGDIPFQYSIPSGFQAGNFT